MPKDTRELIYPEWKIDKDKVTNGENLYYKFCATCHVVAEGGGGVAPDLGYNPCGYGNL